MSNQSMFILSIPEFKVVSGVVSTLDSFDENDNFTTYQATAKPKATINNYIVHTPTIETKIDEVTRECYQILPDFIEQSWPSTTNVRCWWCTHTFTNVPIPLPIGMKANGKMKVKGCFCSFSCCKAYALKEKYDCYLIGYLYRKIMGDLVTTPITPAPSRYCLREYGGPCTIDEFRASSLKGPLFIDTSLVYPQIINSNDFITKKLTRQQYPGLDQLHEKMAKTTNDWKKRVIAPAQAPAAVTKRPVERPARKTSASSLIGSEILRQHDFIGLKVITK